VPWKQLLQSSQNQEEESWNDLRGWHQVRQNSGSGKEVCVRKGEVFHVSSIWLQEPAHWLITNNCNKNHLFQLVYHWLITNKLHQEPFPPTEQLANQPTPHQISHIVQT